MGEQAIPEAAVVKEGLVDSLPAAKVLHREEGLHRGEAILHALPHRWVRGAEALLGKDLLGFFGEEVGGQGLGAVNPKYVYFGVVILLNESLGATMARVGWRPSPLLAMPSRSPEPTAS